MLRSTEVRSPSCDMRNFKAPLPKQLDVMVRRVPYAEPVICMVNEVDLSQLRQIVCREQRWW